MWAWKESEQQQHLADSWPKGGRLLSTCQFPQGLKKGEQTRLHTSDARPSSYSDAGTKEKSGSAEGGRRERNKGHLTSLLNWVGCSWSRAEKLQLQPPWVLLAGWQLSCGMQRAAGWPAGTPECASGRGTPLLPNRRRSDGRRDNVKPWTCFWEEGDSLKKTGGTVRTQGFSSSCCCVTVGKQLPLPSPCKISTTNFICFTGTWVAFCSRKQLNYCHTCPGNSLGKLSGHRGLTSSVTEMQQSGYRSGH